MVALKSSPIWQALGDGAGGFRDTLGNPYPPFAFGSSYAWVHVDRLEARELGLLDDTANRLGATPTGFWKDVEKAVRLHTHANDAEVSVTHPGIARAVRDVIIRPRRAKALTIPLRAKAYGRRPREFANLSGAALFRPKGTRILATEGGGRLTRESASVGGDPRPPRSRGAGVPARPPCGAPPTTPYSSADHSLRAQLAWRRSA